jgi:hypothetical protein
MRVEVHGAVVGDHVLVGRAAVHGDVALGVDLGGAGVVGGVVRVDYILLVVDQYMAIEGVDVAHLALGVGLDVNRLAGRGDRQRVSGGGIFGRLAGVVGVVDLRGRDRFRRF